jgi:exodeoxyribonuclease VII large subunit
MISSQTINSLSVSDLTRCIRAVIEAEDLFADVWVRGEVSNLTKHSSGHVYFSLKDQNALIRAVIWASAARSSRFDLAEGMSVIARGRVTLYEKQGQYQLSIQEVVPDGAGALFAALEQLKARLSAEGLFDNACKCRMPDFPRRIAIVTSPTAAALRDMVTIARRRMPSIDLLLIPTLMQGAEAEASVVESLRLADGLAGVDLIVLGRGGGSIEDLWTFNTESVVRAICACEKPVVSAIGHETDFTLSDMAADLRAPTPSAAMELVVPDAGDIVDRLHGFQEELYRSARGILERGWSRLDTCTNYACFKYPDRMIQDSRQSLDLLDARLNHGFSVKLSECREALGRVAAGLEGLSPLGVLARGYSILRRTADGTVVKSVSGVKAEDEIEALVADGTIRAVVKGIRHGALE